MTRLDTIAQWLQDRDDELLYDADGAQGLSEYASSIGLNTVLYVGGGTGDVRCIGGSIEIRHELPYSCDFADSIREPVLSSRVMVRHRLRCAGYTALQVGEEVPASLVYPNPAYLGTYRVVSIAIASIEESYYELERLVPRGME